MFQTPKGFTYDKPDSIENKEYRLQVGDVFSMQVLSNNGYALVDVVGFNGSFLPIDYNVHNSGYASLPLLDSFYVVGLTAAQLEDSLSVKYSYYFINPFIRINVKNKQAFVFTGRNLSRVVELKNDNMSLVEVIAASGGISTGKARNVRVIRGVGREAKVYVFDLSTVEGYRSFNFVVRSNDIIYIEPIKGPRELYSTIGPILSIFSSAIFIYTVFITGRLRN
jgi:protein involved in polysaccharide export with SLBB domain